MLTASYGAYEEYAFCRHGIVREVSFTAREVLGRLPLACSIKVQMMLTSSGLVPGHEISCAALVSGVRECAM
jgi:hypothetical protein